MKKFIIGCILFCICPFLSFANYGETYNLTDTSSVIYTGKIGLNSSKYGISGDFLERYKENCQEIRSAYEDESSECKNLNFDSDITLLRSNSVDRIKKYLDKGGFPFLSFLTLPPGEDTSKIVISKAYQDGILYIARGDGEWSSSGYRFWFLRYAAKWDEIHTYSIAIPQTGSTDADFIRSFKKNKFKNRSIQQVYQNILTTADSTVIKK